MFKYLAKADKWLEVAFRWGGLLSLLSGAFAWLASRMTFFSNLNWADYIAIGIAAAIGATIMLAVALAQFRKFRPIDYVLPKTVTIPSPSDREQAMNQIGKAGYEIGYEWDEYKAKVNAVESGLEALIADVGRQKSGCADLETRVSQAYKQADATALIFEQFARYIVGKIVLEKKETALRWWDSRNQSLKLITSHLGMQGYYKMQSDSSLSFLDGFVDTTSAREKIESDVAMIKADAAYLIVKDGENFDNGNTKRAWHIECCKLRREKEFLDRLPISLPGEQDLARLAKRAERR